MAARNSHDLAHVMLRMCGRASWTAGRSAVERAFPRVRSIEPLLLAPRYNLAPTQPLPAVLDRDPSALVAVRWGIIPRWVDDAAAGSKMINARIEGVLERPAYRDAFARRRCLVVVDGFFEWRRGDKRKIPTRVVPSDGAPMVFAGLWEPANPTSGNVVTAAIVTKPALAQLAAVHDRMPCVLSNEFYDAWLDAGASPTQLFAVLDAPPPQLTMYEVSPRVNDVRVDDPSCIAPCEPAPTLFP